MASWDTYDPQNEEQYRRDFVLKQPSTVGPWVALGLGVTLVAFIGYLVYVNLLLPSPVHGWAERVAHFDTGTSSMLVASKRSPQRAAERRKSAVTVLPQGRAPNALLGGRGPALPPEQRVAPLGSASPPPRSVAQ